MWLAIEAHSAKALQHAVYCITVSAYKGHEILSLLHIMPSVSCLCTVSPFSIVMEARSLSLQSILAALCMLLCLACNVQLHQGELWPLLSH